MGDIIYVGPVKYELIRSRKKLEKRHTKDNAYGITDHDRQQIIVDDKVGNDIRKDTELHELLHCLWFVLGLNEEKEEETVRPLATGLLDAMRRNKEFFLNLLDDD